MDAILNVDKPLHWTSHDVVAKVRKILRVRKVGHTGTLDPQATGVLLLCIGKATKLTSLLTEEEKEYVSTVHLGVLTDTMDSSGKVLEERDDVELSEEEVKAILESFVGEMEQVPPMFSAIKRGGRPLYKLARAGKIVERKPRRVHIREIELLGFSPPFLTLRVVCSKGTYIRSLAADIGFRLGYGAHLKSLKRTRVGRFSLRDSLSLDRVEELAANAKIDPYLISMDQALEGYPEVQVNSNGARRVSHGNPVYREDLIAIPQGVVDGKMVRIQGPEGKLLAVGRLLPGGPFHPIAGAKPVEVLV